MIRSSLGLTCVLWLGAVAAMFSYAASLSRWSEKEKGLIALLSVSALGPIPPDPSNQAADDPRAAELGRTIFADARFSPDEPGAFKTLRLRGAASRAPYMHAGQIATLDAVLQHYNAAPDAPGWAFRTSAAAA